VCVCVWACVRFLCCDKTSDRSDLQEKRFIWAQGLSGWLLDPPLWPCVKAQYHGGGSWGRGGCSLMTARSEDREGGRDEGQVVPFKSMPAGIHFSNQTPSSIVSTAFQQSIQLQIPKWINPLIRSASNGCPNPHLRTVYTWNQAFHTQALRLFVHANHNIWLQLPVTSHVISLGVSFMKYMFLTTYPYCLRLHNSPVWHSNSFHNANTWMDYVLPILNGNILKVVNLILNTHTMRRYKCSYQWSNVQDIFRTVSLSIYTFFTKLVMTPNSTRLRAHSE
jgi:hypothetical protein